MITRLLSPAARPVAWKGWAIGLFATLNFSIAPPIIKTVINLGVNPNTLLMLRYTAATLLLFGAIAVTSPGKLRLDRRGLALSVTAGLVYSAAILSFAWSLTHINASIAATISALYPLVVLGLLALGGEKFTHRNTMRIALGLAGVYLLIGPGGNASLTGVLLVILANVAFAVHLVMMQWYLKDYHAQTVTMVIAGTIAVCTAAIWLSQNNSFAWPGWPALLLIGVLAVGSTFLGQLAQFAALRLLGSGQMAMLNPPETLLTVIWSILLLHENLTPLQWAGSGLILVSMLLARQRLLRVRVIPWRSGLRLRW